MDPRKETACGFLSAAAGRNECTCVQMLVYTCSLLSSTRAGLFRDTIALSSNLVCSAIWDWLNFISGLSTAQSMEGKGSLGVDNPYFTLVPRAYLPLAFGACCFLQSWLAGPCELVLVGLSELVTYPLP